MESPVGVQTFGDYLHDRTTNHLAELIEGEFGSFALPGSIQLW